MSVHSLLWIDTDEAFTDIVSRLDKLPYEIPKERILKTAMTATARQARKQLIKDNKQRYALKKSGTFSRESKVIAAKTSKLEATVLASGPKHKLYEFTSRQNTARLAARAKVLKEAPLKALEVDNRKAFVATMESGHQGIFQRKTKGRNPIVELVSPTAADMFGRVARKPEVADLVYDMLAKEVEKRIEKALE